MKTITFTFIAIFSVFTAFGQVTTKFIKTRNYKGFILNSEAILDTDVINRKWTPTEHDIQTLEKSLKAYLKNDLKSSSDRNSELYIYKHLDKYLRQYVGYISDDGKKKIYVNFLFENKEFLDRLDKELILVLDGGASYWQIRYDVESKAVVSFSINGVA